LYSPTRILGTRILFNFTPYTYWFAALPILFLGPGSAGADSLIKRWLDGTNKA
jgi:hypothetical protein